MRDGAEVLFDTARQEVELEPAAALLDVGGDDLGDVRRMPVRDQEHRVAAPVHEGTEKLQKAGGIH